MMSAAMSVLSLMASALLLAVLRGSGAVQTHDLPDLAAPSKSTNSSHAYQVKHGQKKFKKSTTSQSNTTNLQHHQSTPFAPHNSQPTPSSFTGPLPCAGGGNVDVEGVHHLPTTTPTVTTHLRQPTHVVNINEELPRGHQPFLRYSPTSHSRREHPELRQITRGRLNFTPHSGLGVPDARRRADGAFLAAATAIRKPL